MWCARVPWLILLAAYFPLIRVTCWVHDLETLGAKSVAVGSLYAVDVLALSVFAGVLGWI